MVTQFNSFQYGVSVENISNSFGGLNYGVSVLSLWNISVVPSGHGHYDIFAEFKTEEKVFKLKTTTSNMQLIDAWKSGMNDLYENGEDGFDDWDEVVESMLSTINAQDQIIESI